MNNRPKSILVAFILLALVAASVSAWLTTRIGDAPVDISVDFTTPPKAPPVLDWSAEDGREYLEMEPIDSRYSAMIGRTGFEVQLTGETNPESPRSDIEFSVDKRAFELPRDATAYPPDGWIIGRTQAASVPDVETPRIRVETFFPHGPFRYWNDGPNPEFRNGREVRFIRGGIINLRLPVSGEERIIDTFGQAKESGERFEVEIPEEIIRSTRFYASVPRRQFHNVRMTVERPPDLRIWRLYIGSFIPRSRHLTNQDPPWVFGQSVEDWTPVWKTPVRFELPDIPAWERGGVATFTTLTLLLFITPLLVIGLAILAFRIFKSLMKTGHLREPYELRPIVWWRPLLLAVPLLLIWTLWLLALWPGNFSPDSLAYWERAHGLKPMYPNRQLHSLANMMVYAVWDHPAAWSAFQILLLSLVAGFAFDFLIRARVPWPLVFVGYAVTFISPRNGHTILYHWSDPNYGVLIYLLTLLTAAWFFGRSRRSWIYWIAVGLILPLIPLYRPNGFAVFLGMLVALPLFLRPNWIKAAIAGVLACAALAGWINAFDRVWNTPYVWTGSIYNTHVIGRYIGQDVALSNDEYRKIDKFTNIYDWREREPEEWRHAAYTPTVAAGPYYQWPQWKKALGERSFDEIRTIFEPWRYLGVRIMNKLARNAYIYDPFPIHHHPPLEELGHASGRQKFLDEFGMKMESRLPWFDKDVVLELSDFWTERENRWLLWRPAIHVWLSLIAMGVLCWRMRSWRPVIIFLPVMFNTAGVFIADNNQVGRLLFPQTISTAFLVLLAFASLRPRKSATEDAPRMLDEEYRSLPAIASAEEAPPDARPPSDRDMDHPAT